MENKFVFIRHDRKLEKINVDHILAIRIDNNYIKLFVKDRDLEYTLRSSFENVLAGLPQNKFLRIHRTYAVSIEQIITIDKSSVVVKFAEEPMPVSREYYPQMIRQITIINGPESDTKKLSEASTKKTVRKVQKKTNKKTTANKKLN